VRTWCRLLVIAAVAIVGIGGWAVARPDPQEKFCTLALGVDSVDGVTLALEDQGGPGRDHCDIDPQTYSGGFAVLTFDCMIVYPEEYTGRRTEQIQKAPYAWGDCGRRQLG
jgi:hypothetical protein